MADGNLGSQVPLPTGTGSAGGSGPAAGSAAGSPQQQVFPPQPGSYVPSFVPPTSPPFPGSAGPITIGFDPNFQAMMLEMMRQEQSAH